MWQSRAHESQDALHATKVLRAILKKVQTPDPGADGGAQCPLSRALSGVGPFEGGSHVCRNQEECETIPAITQTFPEQAVDFDELPALDRFFNNSTTMEWSRFNCPLLFSDVPQL